MSVVVCVGAMRAEQRQLNAMAAALHGPAPTRSHVWRQSNGWLQRNAMGGGIRMVGGYTMYGDNTRANGTMMAVDSTPPNV